MAKRRANGEGSIRKRKDGRWEGRYTASHDLDTGKQIFKSVLGKTQAEVRDKLKRAMEDAKGIDFSRNGLYTVAEWVRLWFEAYSKPSIRETTVEYYRNYIEYHIVPNIGDFKLEKLTSLDIQKMYNKVKTSGRVPRFKNMTDFSLSNRMVRGIHMLLHQCLDQAVKERLILINPTSGCKLPPKDKAEMKIIPPEQIGTYLKEADDWGLLPVFYLELTSGSAPGSHSTLTHMLRRRCSTRQRKRWATLSHRICKYLIRCEFQYTTIIIAITTKHLAGLINSSSGAIWDHYTPVWVKHGSEHFWRRETRFIFSYLLTSCNQA